MLKNNHLTLSIATCASSLLFIWTIPETIALRHILLTIGFVLSVYFLISNQSYFLKRTSWPTWTLVGFYVWLLLHLFLFSSDFSRQIYELKHVWMRCLLATPLGFALGIILIGQKPIHTPGLAQFQYTYTPLSKIFIAILLIGFSSTTLTALCRYLYEIWVTGEYLNYKIIFTFYREKGAVVLGATLCLPLCYILTLSSIHKKLGKWWAIFSTFLIISTLFVVHFMDTKNGILIFCLCLVFFLVTLFINIKIVSAHFLSVVFITILITLTTSIAIEKHLAKNPAWLNIIVDFKMGMDVDHFDYWKNLNIYEQPINVYGDKVSDTVYLRAAWFASGTRILMENPLGYGLLHHSFGHLAGLKHQDFSKPVGNMRGATHWGWLDFALGLGIPGLLFVLIPLFMAWHRSFQYTGFWFSYTSWTIPLLFIAYLTTEIGNGHYIEILLFLTAFFCGITITPLNLANNSKPKHGNHQA